MSASYSTSTDSSPWNLRSARNSAVAGYTAGFVGVVLGHPLDSMKVWAQTGSTGRNKHFATTATSTISSSPPLSTSTTSTTGGSIGGGSSSAISKPAGLQRASMSTLTRSSASISLVTFSLSYFQAPNVLRTIRALYSGASFPLLSVGIVQSINFSTYDTVRRFLHHREAPNDDSGSDYYLHNDSLYNVGIAGFVAGTGLAFITSPLVRIKTQQQITGSGFRDAFRATLFRPHNNNGSLNLLVAGCFVGFYPHLLSETVGRALYYCVYEACKRQIAAYNNNKTEQQQQQQGLRPTVSLTERMAAAAFAGVCCWTVIFPLDSLRNRLYSQTITAATTSATPSPPLSTWNMAKAMYHERALYRGFSLTILRAGPVAAVVLPVYDLVLESLSSYP